MKKNYINHIALVLDASQSMSRLSQSVLTMADQLIAHLAWRSKELDQETRITVYTFNSVNGVTCVEYDKDVLRFGPGSLAGRFTCMGMTPLRDAVIRVLDELGETPTRHGDHGFLCYVLTDGGENSSRALPHVIQDRLNKLADNWTMAMFVPGMSEKYDAQMSGFPPANIAVWDTTVKGVEEVSSRIRQTTDTYMTGRSQGIRGTRTLFAPNTTGLSREVLQNQVDRGALVKLGPGQFRWLAVPFDIPIAPFIEQETRRPYVLGEAYYQLTKPVIVQPSKRLAVYDRKTHSVYVGAHARKLLGLPDFEVKLAPESHSDLDIFVQSTSVNRRLIAGTRVLLLSNSLVPAGTPNHLLAGVMA